MRWFPRAMVRELRDSRGDVTGIEIDNTIIGRRGVCRIVSRMPNCIVLRRPRMFSWIREEVFCEFSIDGHIYEAFEPFGDNDVYWIGPRLGRVLPQTALVKAAFVGPESKFEPAYARAFVPLWVFLGCIFAAAAVFGLFTLREKGAVFVLLSYPAYVFFKWARAVPKVSRENDRK